MRDATTPRERLETDFPTDREATQQMDFFSSVLDAHPDPGIVAAVVIVEVVDERPLPAVGKDDAHKAHPAVGQGRPLLHHLAVAPFGIPSMGHPITKFQKQSPHVHPVPFTSRRTSHARRSRSGVSRKERGSDIDY